jgi:hypothetical protein
MINISDLNVRVGQRSILSDINIEIEDGDEDLLQMDKETLEQAEFDAILIAHGVTPKKKSEIL